MEPNGAEQSRLAITSDSSPSPAERRARAVQRWFGFAVNASSGAAGGYLMANPETALLGAALAGAGPLVGQGLIEASTVMKQSLRDARVVEVLEVADEAIGPDDEEKHRVFRDLVGEAAVAAADAETEAKRQFIHDLIRNAAAVDDARVAALDASFALALIRAMSDNAAEVFGLFCREAGAGNQIDLIKNVKLTPDTRFHHLAGPRALLGANELCTLDIGPLCVESREEERHGYRLLQEGEYKLSATGLWLRSQIASPEKP